ncbi:MAG: hypothetical protein V4819_20130 [Verrucomicrobiota bacterium]
MDQPNNIFAFESRLTFNIFVACGTFEVAEFVDFVDAASLEYVPDKVAIYFPENSIDSTELEEVKQHVQARFHCSPTCFPFDSMGRFGSDESKIEPFLEKGTAEIIRLRQPVILPPPGRSFVKPSGARESYFIQAANLFIRHAEMSFFALLLIRQWGTLFDEGIKTVYVDTIDLYGLISVACRMRFGTESHGPITVSYSSYSSYKEVLKHANVSTSLMVISATTTHKLLRKILQETRWKSIERVVTILDLDSKLLHSPKQVEGPKVISSVTPTALQPHAYLLPSIRLSGEKFTLEVDEPKSVVLNAIRHASCLKHLELQSLKEMVSCFTVYGKNGNERLPICVDPNRLQNNTEYVKWLQREIEKYAPASTSHVVCIGNFADKIIPLLKVFGERLPKVISPESLRDPKLKIDGSIIVICPTFTTGTKLLEISRDIRKHADHKNIVYFTGVGTPVSLSEFTKLKRNLEHQVYQVRSFCNLCTGEPTSLRLSWEAEQELLRDENELGTVGELRERANKLEDGSLSDAEMFYRVSDLELHPGFKYWEKLVDPYPGSHPSVLLFSTFAFLLQNARTDDSLPEKDKLAPLPNRRVLLDPENFFRYNDSLLQVAILRAAFPGELDYSDHSAHSMSMVYLFQRAEQIKQRAMVYELLLALASRRLSITPQELKRVKAIIEVSPMSECKWFREASFFKGVAP